MPASISDHDPAGLPGQTDQALLPALPPTGEGGYDWIQELPAAGWYAVPGWGALGWDLGNWPLVVVAHHDGTDLFGHAVYVEGDLTVAAFTTQAARDAATDQVAAWWWRWYNTGPDDLPAESAALLDQHRGPFHDGRIPPASPAAPAAGSGSEVG